MIVHGYMVEADWDGTRLLARGTNRAGKVALLGPDMMDPVVAESGQVEIPARAVAGVELEPPKMGGMVNGCLTVATTAGRRYPMHFRRKDAAQWSALAEELRGATSA